MCRNVPNGGNGERTGTNEHITQLHVFWKAGSRRSQTIYRKFHQLGGMSSLWKNAFSLPKQGRPPVPIARPTQTADPSDIDALVGYRKNRLGRDWRINDERQEQAKNALRHGKRMKGREHMSTSDSGTPGPELSRPIGRTLHRAARDRHYPALRISPGSGREAL